MIYKNLIFQFDLTILNVDEIAEEDNVHTNIGDNTEPDNTSKDSSNMSLGGWNENWLDLKEIDDICYGWTFHIVLRVYSSRVALVRQDKANLFRS